MKPLSSFRPEIQKRVRNASKVLLFLDYDGTLVPIRPTPELARLSPERKKILAGLARLPAFNVGILTGRSLKNIRTAVKIPGMFFAANYGLAIATPKRHPMAPNVPTFTEKGYPQVVMSSDRGIAAPKGVSPETVKILVEAFWKAAQAPEFKGDMNKAGVDVVLLKGEDILKYWAETETRIRDLLLRLKLVEK